MTINNSFTINGTVSMTGWVVCDGSAWEFRIPLRMMWENHLVKNNKFTEKMKKLYLNLTTSKSWTLPSYSVYITPDSLKESMSNHWKRYTRKSNYAITVTG